MTTSKLMQCLLDCENKLGWIPAVGKNGSLQKSRSVMHKVLTSICETKDYTEDDIALTIDYCARRRLPISTPLQLIPMVPVARAYAKDERPMRGLDAEQAEAIAWEEALGDDMSSYWLHRLTRSVNRGLVDTLTEWSSARGVTRAV